jgi:hypothetical protein
MMEVIIKKIDDLIEFNDCPLPLDVIPNRMGINLSSVDAIGWQKQSDGQLANLTIYFKPSLIGIACKLKKKDLING